MKLRIRGNSIRLRLTQGEVSRLASGEIIEERLEFGRGMQCLTYSLERSSGTGSVSAAYAGDRIRVVLADEVAARWIESDDVGVDRDVDGLRVLIEKDFACLKPRAGEDESDMFPHPENAACEA